MLQQLPTTPRLQTLVLRCITFYSKGLRFIIVEREPMKRILTRFKTNEIVGICFVILIPLAAYIIKKHVAMTNPGEFGALIGSFTTLIAGLYGIFWFWPNYLQQKRLENLITTTKEGLGGILETEEKIKRLFFVLLSDHGSIEDQIKAQFDLSYAVTRLKNAVLLLQRDADLVPNGAIQRALRHISQLEDLLHNKNTLKSFSNATLFTKDDVTHKSSILADLIEKLKEDLLQIYDMGE